MRDVPKNILSIFDRHGVPVCDRAFLYAALDRLIEEDIDNIDVAGAAKAGVLEADSYEELLQQHDRGHRRNKPWFRSAAFEDAVPTKRGRSLLKDFAAALPAPIGTGNGEASGS